MRFLHLSILALVFLLAVSSCDGRRGGRGGGRSGKSGSRSTSRSGSSKSKGSKSSSRGSGSASKPSKYTASSVRTTYAGRRVVPYRDFRSGYAPVIYSPIVHRPGYIHMPIIYSNYHYRRRWNDHNRQNQYYDNDDVKNMEKLFLNIKTHCSGDTEYGIDGKQSYMIMGLQESAMESWNTPVNVSSCSFKLVAPSKAVLRVVFGTSQCHRWPPNCKMTVSDVGGDSLMTLTRWNKPCDKQALSNTNRIAISVSSCTDDLSDFDFSLMVDVAVESSDESEETSWTTIIIIIVVAVCFALCCCCCVYKCRGRGKQDAPAQPMSVETGGAQPAPPSYALSPTTNENSALLKQSPPEYQPTAPSYASPPSGITSTPPPSYPLSPLAKDSSAPPALPSAPRPPTEASYGLQPSAPMYQPTAPTY